MKAFDARNTGEVALGDPYQIAFLAGGANRCAQLAVSRLLQSGALIWRKGGAFRSGRLLAARKDGSQMNDIERSLHQGAVPFGAKGMPLTSVAPLVTPRLRGIELGLATLGLRPTGSERAGLGIPVVLPLIVLMLIGVVKIFIGLSRGKPVVFLLLAEVVTLVASLAVASSCKRLTPTGERTLNALRKRHSLDSGRADAISMSMGVALLGPAALAGYAWMFPSDVSFQQELTQLGRPGGEGSSGGCSSGCGGGGGGGGCGGGGCGGCGGD